jgi:hypothetical protein
MDALAAALHAVNVRLLRALTAKKRLPHNDGFVAVVSMRVEGARIRDKELLAWMSTPLPHSPTSLTHPPYHLKPLTHWREFNPSYDGPPLESPHLLTPSPCLRRRPQMPWNCWKPSFRGRWSAWSNVLRQWKLQRLPRWLKQTPGRQQRWPHRRSGKSTSQSCSVSRSSAYLTRHYSC